MKIMVGTKKATPKPILARRWRTKGGFCVPVPALGLETVPELGYPPDSACHGQCQYRALGLDVSWALGLASHLGYPC